MQYRAEIDGLRAVAVIPVILFHAELDLFEGGFVGVDIFFVISGFLITSIILRDLENGSFSLLDFYERRARRILPALFFIMLASIPFAWFWMMPSDMKDFSQSFVAVSAFASNILFWQEVGYWGTASQLKPLLHTWSLAVEEQYYLLFPVVLIVLFKLRLRTQLFSLAALWFASLAWTHWGISNRPLATFYLLPTRAWELLSGAGLAYAMLYFPNSVTAVRAKHRAVELLSLLGLVLIGIAIFTFDKKTPFPSTYTLVPVAGVVLILLCATPNTAVGRLLSMRLATLTGLMSYSIYLWHQPLIAFTRHRSVVEPSSSVLLIASLLSIPLAYLTWRFVETPFRDRNRFSRTSIFSGAFVGSLAFIAVGLAGTITEGFQHRNNHSQFSQDELRAKLDRNMGLSDACEAQFPPTADCMTSEQPEIVVWGDSHAKSLVEGILASDPDAKLVQLTKGTCGPFFDIAPIALPKYPRPWAESCLEFNAQVRSWLSEHKSVQFAVLASPFSQYLSDEARILTRTGQVTESDSNLVHRSFQNTLAELRSLQIEPIIFAPAPTTGTNIGRCLAMSEWRGIDLSNCNMKMDQNLDDRAVTESFLKQFEEDFTVVFLSQLMCQGESCPAHVEELFLYRDSNHLSREGSRHLGIKHDFANIIRRSRRSHE